MNAAAVLITATALIACFAATATGREVVAFTYRTVTEILTECSSFPEVAVTRIDEVTGAGPPPPPPQATANRPTATTMDDSASMTARRRLRPSTEPPSREAANSVPLVHGSVRGLTPASLELADTVIVTVAAEVCGVTLEGAKLQLMPAGKLEHEKVTGCL